MSDDLPYVAIGKGEDAPWVKANLGLSCPNCGGDELPLRDSNPPGLTFIKCDLCEGTWLRGRPRFEEIFKAPEGGLMSAHTAHATAHKSRLSRGSNRSPRSGPGQHRQAPCAPCNLGQTALACGLAAPGWLCSVGRSETAGSSAPPTNRPRQTCPDRPRLGGR